MRPAREASGSSLDLLGEGPGSGTDLNSRWQGTWCCSAGSCSGAGRQGRLRNGRKEGPAKRSLARRRHKNRHGDGFRRSVLHSQLCLKTQSAQYWSAQSRSERYRSLLPAGRTGRYGFRASPCPSPAALGLAWLAVRGVVGKALAFEEYLFARCKDKIGTAIFALQRSIGIFHDWCPLGS